MVALSLMVGLASSSVVGFSPNPVTAGGQVSVRVEPASQTVPAESKASVQVRVQNVENLEGYQFRLAFDPEVLEYQSIDEERTFLESTGRSAFCLPGPNDFELTQAIIRFGCTSSGTSEGPSGAGLLAEITFATTCSNTSGSDLVFVPLLSNEGVVVGAVELTNVIGQGIPAVSLGGEINVDSCTPPSTATPTITPPPAPTQTPGNVLAGDVSCDGTTNALDAALLLQVTAGLLLATPCPWNGDVNGDGSHDPLDATLILQFDAGLIGELTLAIPPANPTPTTTPIPPTTTRRPTFTPPPTVTAAFTPTSTPAPSLSPAEAVALAFDWLTEDPPAPYFGWAIDYDTCSATWMHTAWHVICQGTRVTGDDILVNDLQVCVFEETFIVTPFPC